MCTRCTVTPKTHKPLISTTVKIVFLVLISLPFLQSLFTQQASCAVTRIARLVLSWRTVTVCSYCIAVHLCLHHHCHCKMNHGQHLLYSLKPVTMMRNDGPPSILNSFSTMHMWVKLYCKIAISHRVAPSSMVQWWPDTCWWRSLTLHMAAFIKVWSWPAPPRHGHS